MRRMLFLISMLSLLLIGADHSGETVRLTVINKSGMEISIQLRSQDNECLNSNEIVRGEFYYLTVLEGDRDQPSIKAFDIQEDTYGMQLFYRQTYDPVYGFKCVTPETNALIARRNIRLVILPCDYLPAPNAVGEPTMWKYLPFSVKEYALFFNRYWLTRLIY